MKLSIRKTEFILLMKTGAVIYKYTPCESCIMHTALKTWECLLMGIFIFIIFSKYFLSLLSCWTCNLFFPPCLFMYVVSYLH